MRNIKALLTMLILMLSSIQSAHGEIQFFRSDPTMDRSFLEIRSYFLEAVDYLNNIELSESSMLHKKFFGRTLSKGVYRGVLSRIQRATVLTAPDKFAIAYASSKSRAIAITNNFPAPKNSDDFILALSVLIHEAWHIKPSSGYYSPQHSLCPQKDLSGEPLISIARNLPLLDSPSCDTQLTGAYAAQTVMLSNIAQFCTNCSSEIKESAKSLSEVLIKRIISRKALKLLKKDLGMK